MSIPAHAADKELIENGEMTYDNNCSNCHGLSLQSSGMAFDLRKLKAAQYKRFVNSVLNGKNNRMPPWKGVLEMNEINAIWAYIRFNVDKGK